MPSSSPLRLYGLLLLCCLFLGAQAVPVAVKRQSLADGQVQTLMTQSTTSTPQGDMTQTCVITLTPINGGSEIQEVKNCTLSLAGSNNVGGGVSDSSSSSSTDSSSTDSSGSTSTDSSNTSTDSGSSTTDSASTSTATDGTGSNGAVSANGVSEVTPSPSATDSTAATATDSTGASASAAVSGTDSSSASATSAAATGAGVSGGTITTISAPAAANGGAAPAATTPVAAAEQAASASSSAFVVPGQSLQVLPIGLGIFGGISGIAIIVVLYLTYRRRAYRKAFRARKLAEAGAAMGYGGTRA